MLKDFDRHNRPERSQLGQRFFGFECVAISKYWLRVRLKTEGGMATISKKSYKKSRSTTPIKDRA